MILITGATGYVGAHLVHALRSRGRRVRCVVRPQAPEDHSSWLRQWNAEPVSLDLLDREQVESALEGIEKIMHLVGAERRPDDETTYRKHVEKTTSLLKAAQGKPISRFVLLSTLGARPDADATCCRTKWQAEEAVRQSGLPYLILRPSLIFGKLVGERDSFLMTKLSEGILGGSLIPIIGKGQNLIQPLFIGDLINCLLAALDRDDLIGRRLDVGGPEKMTFSTLVDILAEHYRKPARKVRLSAKLAMVIAWLSERISGSPWVSLDQVVLMRESQTCDPKVLNRIFQIEPIRVRTGLSMRFWPEFRFHPLGTDGQRITS